MKPLHRLRWATIALVAVVVLGSAGYVLLGFGPLEALYQTITTITTVGFSEVKPLSDVGRVYTMVLILAGVGTTLYALGVAAEAMIAGELTDARKTRRMQRKIDRLHDHVIVCGWGRVGKAIAANVAHSGQQVVIVDHSAERLADVDHLSVVGDATHDDILLQAGIERAKALVAAIDTDAENLYVTLSGRSLCPDLFIIARARDEASDAKLLRAGANRVVNPQAIGGARMAAFVSQPHVAEFLDVVMHERQVEFRLEEIAVGERSPLAGTTIGSAAIRERTGALVLALRHANGDFVSNPPTSATLVPGQILIAIGTPAELAALGTLSAGG